MSNKKLFESDISRSLVATGLYYYKPIDMISAGADKVDFFLCYGGTFVAIEAKEVKGHSCPPSQFSEGQKLCLRSVAKSGGIALVLVNFGRKPLNRDKGRTGAWCLYPDRDLEEWPTFREDDWQAELTPVKGGWDLEDLLPRFIRRGYR